MREPPVRLAVGLVLLSLVTARPAPPDDEGTSATTQAADPPTITVHARPRRELVRAGLLGVNHHYSGNGYGIWDAARDRPRPVVVEYLRRAHVRLIRYSGGTVASLVRR